MITNQDDDAALREDGFEQTAALLDLLLWNGPSTMIPTREAVTAWRALLVDRGPVFASLVLECDGWLSPAGAKYEVQLLNLVLARSGNCGDTQNSEKIVR